MNFNSSASTTSATLPSSSFEVSVLFPSCQFVNFCVVLQWYEVLWRLEATTSPAPPTSFAALVPEQSETAGDEDGVYIWCGWYIVQRTTDWRRQILQTGKGTVQLQCGAARADQSTRSVVLHYTWEDWSVVFQSWRGRSRKKLLTTT